MKYRYRFILLIVGMIIAMVEPQTDEVNKWFFWTIVVKLVGIGLMYFGTTYNNVSSDDNKKPNQKRIINRKHWNMTEQL